MCLREDVCYLVCQTVGVLMCVMGCEGMCVLCGVEGMSALPGSDVTLGGFQQMIKTQRKQSDSHH